MLKILQTGLLSNSYIYSRSCNQGVSVIFPLGYKPALENSSHFNHLSWKMSQSKSDQVHSSRPLPIQVMALIGCLRHGMRLSQNFFFWGFTVQEKKIFPYKILHQKHKNR